MNSSHSNWSKQMDSTLSVRFHFDCAKHFEVTLEVMKCFLNIKADWLIDSLINWIPSNFAVQSSCPVHHSATLTLVRLLHLCVTYHQLHVLWQGALWLPRQPAAEYLRQTVGSGLEDDQQHSDGHGDLLQLQAMSHPGPAQHPAHAVLGGGGNLPQADGQAAQFGRRQAEALHQRRRQEACNTRQTATEEFLRGK